MNNNILFGALVSILVFGFASSAFAHVSNQQRYNDGYNTGQDYAACDYTNCDHGNQGYDAGCPNDKKHTYEFCNGYSLGYKNKWSSLAGEMTTQQQTQSQVQEGSTVRIEGSHNNLVIEPRQSQEQAASSSNSDSDSGEYGEYK
jgi:hypothetical protein